MSYRKSSQVQLPVKIYRILYTTVIFYETIQSYSPLKWQTDNFIMKYSKLKGVVNFEFSVGAVAAIKSLAFCRERCFRRYSNKYTTGINVVTREFKNRT